jgi:Long-chain fatty aldehyde decarbonylase
LPNTPQSEIDWEKAVTIRNITKDAMYDAVAPDDFESLIEIDRYNNRSSAFDKIISATHDHFWDPLNKDYIDFDEPFDMENQPMVPETLVVGLQTDYVSNHLSDPKQRTAFINEVVRWNLSSILHGEQGALNLSASLCHVLKDQGAQEYAANQAREEARHVTAFAKYIKARWGAPVECGPVLKNLLVEIIGAPEVYKKIIGMQMLVEGLAMGAFATFFKEFNDPLGRKLMQLVMTDEAFHHKFGKIWADRTIPKLDAEEHAIIEDWAAHCFQTLLFNLVAPHQMRPVYEKFGLDPDKVMEEFQKIATDDQRRENMKESTNIFRVLVKTLLNAGIITERTRAFYATYVDMEELKAEGDHMVGDDIAEEGIRYLQSVNFKKPVNPVLVAAE